MNRSYGHNTANDHAPTYTINHCTICNNIDASWLRVKSIIIIHNYLQGILINITSDIDILKFQTLHGLNWNKMVFETIFLHKFWPFITSNTYNTMMEAQIIKIYIFGRSPNLCTVSTMILRSSNFLNYVPRRGHKQWYSLQRPSYLEYVLIHLEKDLIDYNKLHLFLHV